MCRAEEPKKGQLSIGRLTAGILYYPCKGRGEKMVARAALKLEPQKKIHRKEDHKRKQGLPKPEWGSE